MHGTARSTDGPLHVRSPSLLSAWPSLPHAHACHAVGVTRFACLFEVLPLLSEWTPVVSALLREGKGKGRVPSGLCAAASGRRAQRERLSLSRPAVIALVAFATTRRLSWHRREILMRLLACFPSRLVPRAPSTGPRWGSP